jgi:hypothetical protein
MIVLSPFWTWAARGLLELLLVVSGPSIFIYLFVWIFACFRREDLARWVLGWRGLTPEAAAADVPTRKRETNQRKSARKSQLLAGKTLGTRAKRA